MYVCIFPLHVILYVCTRLHAYDGVFNVLCSAPRVRMPRCPRPSHLLALLLKQMLKFIRSPLWVEECVFIMYTLIIQVSFIMYGHCMCICVCVCVCVRACVRACVHTCVCVCVHTSVCVCLCLSVWACTCMCLSGLVCVYVCVHACVSVVRVCIISIQLYVM